jgi:hypothetical protein
MKLHSWGVCHPPEKDRKPKPGDQGSEKPKPPKDT